MKIFFTSMGLLFLTILVFAIYRLITVKRQNARLHPRCFDRIEELYHKLENGEAVTENDIRPFTENILTRQTAFRLLADRGKTNLFPTEYNTLISGAESNLANWLEFPTELGICPDEIEYVKRVTLEDKEQKTPIHYEVFKYKMNEPHRAAKDGWVLGVVGPYFDDSKPYDHPHAIFSRGNTANKVTPEEEAKWVHQNIAMK